MKYYLFKIKKSLYKKDDEYLFNTLKKLKKTKNYTLGINLFNSLCDRFDTNIINNYLNLRYNINSNGYYSFNNGLVKLVVKPSRVIIKSNNDIKDIVKIFKIYDYDIFMCDFKYKSYYWISDYLNN